MNKGKKLYEGKAKILYEGPEKGTIIQHFKDDATAFNNSKKTTVEGKGVLNNRISEHILNNLNQIGIKTHLIKRLNMREQLVRLRNILKNMNVYPKKMLKNLNITKGLIFSQRVMIELTKHGFSREKAYLLVQRNAQKSWVKNVSFYESLTKDSLINKKISNKDLTKMFDINYHTKRINVIYKRVFK